MNQNSFKPFIFAEIVELADPEDLFNLAVIAKTRGRERERMGSNRKLREVEWCAIPATLALLILHFRLLDGPGEMKPVM